MKAKSNITSALKPFPTADMPAKLRKYVKPDWDNLIQRGWTLTADQGIPGSCTLVRNGCSLTLFVGYLNGFGRHWTLRLGAVDSKYFKLDICKNLDCDQVDAGIARMCREGMRRAAALEKEARDIREVIRKTGKAFKAGTSRIPVRYQH